MGKPKKRETYKKFGKAQGGPRFGKERRRGNAGSILRKKPTFEERHRHADKTSSRARSTGVMGEYR